MSCKLHYNNFVVPRVDLVLTRLEPVAWQFGATLPDALTSAFGWSQDLFSTSAEALLFWDPALGQPSGEVVLKALNSPRDVWHAGLLVAMQGLPRTVDFVQPTWMFNCDPPADIEATSWRVSLRACLVRTEVIRKMGFLRPEFQTVEAAALEWGHRLLLNGVFMRHLPALLPTADRPPPSVRLPFADELRFIYYRYGRKWAAWAMFRAVMTHYATLPLALGAWRSVVSTQLPSNPPPFRSCAYSTDTPAQGQTLSPSSVLPPTSSKADPQVSAQPPEEPQPLTLDVQPPRVSVVIPTIQRYPFLRKLLEHLCNQTVAPVQVLIVDQTPEAERDYNIAGAFPNLPIKLIHQDEPGQCTSRNTALSMTTGDYILFVDDDDEVEPDLIARHLETLTRYEAEVSCGVVEDNESGPPTGSSLIFRASDVFPTNNTLVRKDVLRRSGLFDLAYNRGARADGDLGLRVYLSGSHMVLNPDICLFHHHAPRGGLRVHGARVVTRTSSRSKLWHRHLPSATESYLARRYFTPRQVTEGKWIRALGTFSSKGTAMDKLAKAFVSLLMLPNTIWQIRRNDAQAKAMLRAFPVIPTINDGQLP